MGASKTPLSGASSYRGIGDYWDSHDLSDHWDETREVQFDVNIQSSAIYFAVERSLAEKLKAAAENRGVSPETLLNELVEERIATLSPK
jgi:CopG antitoxin of type II toxin-antitoxin system